MGFPGHDKQHCSGSCIKVIPIILIHWAPKVFESLEKGQKQGKQENT